MPRGINDSLPAGTQASSGKGSGLVGRPMTRSPGAKPLSASATSTSPANSSPALVKGAAGLNWYSPRGHQQIGEVERSRAHLHQHLA